MVPTVIHKGVSLSIDTCATANTDRYSLLTALEAPKRWLCSVDTVVIAIAGPVEVLVRVFSAAF
jgi:hypothetical protein